MVADPETLEPVPKDNTTLGEVFMRGNLVMKGYLKNQATTEKSFKGGWFHTGDLAVWGKDSYIQLKDRSKDIRFNSCDRTICLPWEIRSLSTAANLWKASPPYHHRNEAKCGLKCRLWCLICLLATLALVMHSRQCAGRQLSAV